MKIVFIRGAEQGEAEYDHSTETYSWSYDGDDSKITDLLSMLEDGRKFSDISTDDSTPDSDDNPALEVGESWERLPWYEQIDKLADVLRFYDFKILYQGT